MKGGGLVEFQYFTRDRAARKECKRLILQYRTPEMVRDGIPAKQRGFYTMDERETFLKKLQEDAQKNAGLSKDTTFQDYAAKWLAGKKNGWAPPTYANHEWSLSHILPWAEGRPADLQKMRTYSPGDVRRFLTGKVGELSKGSVKLLHSTLHKLFGDAMEDDSLIPTNPAHFTGDRRLGFTPTRGERKAAAREKTMTEEQAVDFLAAEVPGLGGYVMLFRVMILTGLRIGEALALHWDQLALEVAKPHVYVCRLARRKGAIVKRTKNKGTRDVDLPPDLVVRLRAWDVKAKAAALAKGKERPALLFPSIRGTVLDYKQVHGAFASILKAAKLAPYFSPHSLRHTFASRSLDAGMPMDVLSYQLGHSSIEITVDLYGSGRTTSRPEYAAALERRLAGLADVEQERKAK